MFHEDFQLGGADTPKPCIANHVSDKGLLPKKYKKLIQFNSKKMRFKMGKGFE